MSKKEIADAFDVEEEQLTEIDPETYNGGDEACDAEC